MRQFVFIDWLGNIIDHYFCIHFLSDMKKTQHTPESERHQVGEDVSQDINTRQDEGTNEFEDSVVEKETEILKAKIAELNDKFLRQAAEFENYKRRNAKERIELIQTAGRDVIVDLLDVIDDSDRAQKQMEVTTDPDQIKEGVSLVFSKLKSTLTAKGLKAMDAKGSDFDPDLHEAIAEIEAGEEMKGKVIDEIQKGYYLNDKIIRYAKVVVGK
jgi:molecular chaperone GrpE